MSCIKIRCYIVSSYDDKKVKIEINDEESLEKMNGLIIKLNKNKKYKISRDKECNNRFFITLNNKTNYSFKNINYNNISDLYGLEVFITFYSKYYSFKYLQQDPDDPDKKKELLCSGFYFIATKITNIKIFND